MYFSLRTSISVVSICLVRSLFLSFTVVSSSTKYSSTVSSYFHCLRCVNKFFVVGEWRAIERMTSDESQDTEPSTAEICGNIQWLPSQNSLGRKGQTMPTFRGQEGKYKTKQVVYKNWFCLPQHPYMKDLINWIEARNNVHSPLCFIFSSVNHFPVTSCSRLDIRSRTITTRVRNSASWVHMVWIHTTCGVPIFSCFTKTHPIAKKKWLPICLPQPSPWPCCNLTCGFHVSG